VNGHKAALRQFFQQQEAKKHDVVTLVTEQEYKNACSLIEDQFLDRIVDEIFGDVPEEEKPIHRTADDDPTVYDDWRIMD
jgi:hypothetical protein